MQVHPAGEVRLPNMYPDSGMQAGVGVSSWAFISFFKDVKQLRHD